MVTSCGRRILFTSGWLAVKKTGRRNRMGVPEPHSRAHSTSPPAGSTLPRELGATDQPSPHRLLEVDMQNPNLVHGMLLHGPKCTKQSWPHETLDGPTWQGGKRQVFNALSWIHFIWSLKTRFMCSSTGPATGIAISPSVHEHLPPMALLTSSHPHFLSDLDKFQFNIQISSRCLSRAKHLSYYEEFKDECTTTLRRFPVC